MVCSMIRLPRLLLVLLAPLVIALAGCGGGGLSANPSTSTFTISPATTTIDTNGQVQFTATLAGGGAATNVNWVVLNGQNNAQVGQGSIDSTGLYLPPTAVTQNSVQVQVQANLAGNTSQLATAVINVTPGFVQPILPETATLSGGATLPLSATIAEVGGGSVNWSLSSSPTTVANPGSSSGSIGNTNCQVTSINSNNPQFTFCTATYTAPSGSLPSAPLYAVATVASNSATISTARLLLNNAGLNTSPLDNQAAQTAAVQMGTSGGNNGDVDLDPSGNPIDCASGTLGSLVNDQSGNLYVLSNNHVLAESDQAAVGSTIIQPGLVDTGCVPLAAGVTGIRAIASLQYYVPLINASTNTDAALAITSASSVDTTGSIVALGASGGGTNQIAAAAPAAGQGETLSAANLNTIQVAKSGRTTGLTCSTVDSIDNSLKISYYRDAAGTQFYTSKTFTNQIGIPGNYFSDFGDSGSLVVDAANAQAVGLFFAGSAGSGSTPGESFANPIGNVFSDLAQFSSAPAGTSFSMVGGAPHPVNCINYDQNTAALAGATVPAALLSSAQAVVNQNAASLVNPGSGILGVAVGKSLDHPGQPAVLVYIDSSRSGAAVPQTVGGLRTRVIPTTASAYASGNAPASAAIAPGIHLSAATLEAAANIHKQVAGKLMSDPAFFGVGVTQSQDNPAEAALMVYVDQTRTPRQQPATMNGLRLRYRTLKPIHVTPVTAKAK
jgi:hypothetical protein